MIRIKRVYEPPEPGDGARFLVERLWPRGMKKDALPLDGWAKEAAPSHALRRWFNHATPRWEVFRGLYRAELDERLHAWQPLFEAARDGTVTLLYSAHDRDHNSAIVLREYLERALAGARSRVSAGAR